MPLVPTADAPGVTLAGSPSESVTSWVTDPPARCLLDKAQLLINVVVSRSLDVRLESDLDVAAEASILGDQGGRAPPIFR